jgi:hypothetical protein
MKHKFLIILNLIIFTCIVKAQTLTQEVKASSGGFYQQINGSMQVTMGEPLTESYSNSSAKLYQGFEQGSYAIVSVEELTTIENLNVNLFPNPSNGIFKVDIKSDDVLTFTIDVKDALGKSIISKIVKSNEIETIDLTAFASSMYHLTISNSDKNYLKTFKIIKQ